jgi:hypothetical protein
VIERQTLIDQLALVEDQVALTMSGSEGNGKS